MGPVTLATYVVTAACFILCVKMSASAILYVGSKVTLASFPDPIPLMGCPGNEGRHISH